MPFKLRSTQLERAAVFKDFSPEENQGVSPQHHLLQTHTGPLRMEKSIPCPLLNF